MTTKKEDGAKAPPMRTIKGGVSPFSRVASLTRAAKANPDPALEAQKKRINEIVERQVKKALELGGTVPYTDEGIGMIAKAFAKIPLEQIERSNAAFDAMTPEQLGRFAAAAVRTVPQELGIEMDAAANEKAMKAAVERRIKIDDLGYELPWQNIDIKWKDGEPESRLLEATISVVPAGAIEDRLKAVLREGDFGLDRDGIAELVAELAKLEGDAAAAVERAVSGLEEGAKKYNLADLESVLPERFKSPGSTVPESYNSVVLKDEEPETGGKLYNLADIQAELAAGFDGVDETARPELAVNVYPNPLASFAEETTFPHAYLNSPAGRLRVAALLSPLETIPEVNGRWLANRDPKRFAKWVADQTMDLDLDWYHSPDGRLAVVGEDATVVEEPKKGAEAADNLVYHDPHGNKFEDPTKSFAERPEAKTGIRGLVQDTGVVDKDGDMFAVGAFAESVKKKMVKDLVGETVLKQNEDQTTLEVLGTLANPQVSKLEFKGEKSVSVGFDIVPVPVRPPGGSYILDSEGLVDHTYLFGCPCGWARSETIPVDPLEVEAAVEKRVLALGWVKCVRVWRCKSCVQRLQRVDCPGCTATIIHKRPRGRAHVFGWRKSSDRKLRCEACADAFELTIETPKQQEEETPDMTTTTPGEDEQLERSELDRAAAERGRGLARELEEHMKKGDPCAHCGAQLELHSAYCKPCAGFTEEDGDFESLAREASMLREQRNALQAALEKESAGRRHERKRWLSETSRLSVEAGRLRVELAQVEDPAGRIAVLNHQLDSARSVMDDWQTRATLLEGILSDAQAKNMHLEAAVANANLWRAARNEDEDRVAELECELSKCAEINRNAEQLVEDLESRIVELKGEVAAVEKDRADIQDARLRSLAKLAIVRDDREATRKANVEIAKTNFEQADVIATYRQSISRMLLAVAAELGLEPDKFQPNDWQSLGDDDALAVGLLGVIMNMVQEHARASKELEAKRVAELAALELLLRTYRDEVESTVRKNDELFDDNNQHAEELVAANRSIEEIDKRATRNATRVHELEQIIKDPGKAAASLEHRLVLERAENAKNRLELANLDRHVEGMRIKHSNELADLEKQKSALLAAGDELRIDAVANGALRTTLERERDELRLELLAIQKDPTVYAARGCAKLYERRPATVSQSADVNEIVMSVSAAVAMEPAELEAAKSALEKHMTGPFQRLKLMDDINSSWSYEVGRLRSDLNKLRATLEATEDELKSCHIELENEMTLRSDIQAKWGTTCRLLEQTDALMHALRAELEKLKSAPHTVDPEEVLGALEATEHELESVKSEHDKIREQLRHNSTVASGMIEELRADLVAAKTEVDNLQAQAKGRNEYVMKLDRSLEGAHDRLNAASHEAGVERSRVDILGILLTTLEEFLEIELPSGFGSFVHVSQKAALEGRVLKVRESLSKLFEQGDKAASARSRLTSILYTVRADRKAMKAQRDDANRKVAMLEHDREKTAAFTTQDRASSKAEIAELRAQVKEPRLRMVDVNDDFLNGRKSTCLDAQGVDYVRLASGRVHRLAFLVDACELLERLKLILS